MTPGEPPPRLDIEVAAPAPAAPATVAPAGGRGWAQLGAFRTRQKAEDVLRAWRMGEPSPPPLRVRAVQVRSGKWFRVVAGPLSSDEARRLCRRAPAYGGGCWTRGDPE